MLESIDAINTNHLGKSSWFVDKLRTRGHKAKRAERALEERCQLILQQEESVAELLSENEIAVTALNKLSAEWAKLKLIHGRKAAVGREALRELGRIVAQVERYGAPEEELVEAITA